MSDTAKDWGDLLEIGGLFYIYHDLSKDGKSRKSLLSA